MIQYLVHCTVTNSQFCVVSDEDKNEEDELKSHKDTKKEKVTLSLFTTSKIQELVERVENIYGKLRKYSLSASPEALTTFLVK